MRHPQRRLVLAALSTVVVLAVLGFGVSTLVERLGRDQSVVVITDDSMSPSASGSPSATLSGNTTTGSPSSIVITGPETLSDAATPQETILRASWGSGPGQFAGPEVPGPRAFAVSEETGSGRIIALGDEENYRVQFFRWNSDGATSFLREVSIPDIDGGLRDFVIDPKGNTYVLKGQEVLGLRADSDEVKHFPLDETIVPARLYLNGFNLYVQADDGTSYPVAALFEPAPERAPEWGSPKNGVPVYGPTEGRVLSLSVSQHQVEVKDSTNAGQVQRVLSVSSPDLPIQRAWILGQDAIENIWLLLHIYGEGWQGTESRLIVAISPQGEKVGELRLPLDETGPLDVVLDPVSPFGVFELRRTAEEGIAINRYTQVVGSVTTVTTVAPSGASTTFGEASATHDQVYVQVPAIEDIRALSFLDWWRSLAEAAGGDPEGASLEDFSLFYRPAGKVHLASLQSLTRDGWFLSLAGGDTSMSWYGHRLVEGETIPPSSWSTPLDPVMVALDLVGIETLEERLPETTDPVTGYSISTPMRNADGGAGEQLGDRLYYYSSQGFVLLDANDERRSTDQGDVLIVLRTGRAYNGGERFEDSTYFIIPAEALL